MRSSLRRTGVALAAALLAVGASPLPASAAGGLTTVCEGTVSGVYSPPLLASPALAPVTLTVGPSTLSCAGPTTHSVTVSVSGDQLAGASCTGPVAFVGGGQITADTVNATPVQWTAVGTGLAQAWVFSDVVGLPPAVEAAGLAAVLDPSAAPACLSSGVSNVTFTVVLVIVA